MEPLKKKLNQLRFSDLAEINKELGNPIRDNVLQWIYTQLHQMENKKAISVKSIDVTNSEINALYLLDNALHKKFILPDPEIYNY